MENYSFSVDLIREVFHYQSRFTGSIMVFKIDYPVTESPGFPGLVKDLALLAQTGFKVIIVPGTKENKNAVLEEQSISYFKMAAYDVASKFMTFLSGCRVEAIIGNFVRARGLGIINGEDSGFAGTVDKIYAVSLRSVLDLGMVPIIPCIGLSPTGKPYSVSSDEIALAVSSVLGAAKLFILSTHNGLNLKDFNFNEEKSPAESVSLLRRSLGIIRRKITKNLETRQDGSLIRLTPGQVQSLINAYKDDFEPKPENSPGLRYIRELELALKASKAGVNRIHIVNGTEEGIVLRELFSNFGGGTMVNIDEYDSIRALRSGDLPDILRLMEPFMQNGILIRRNAEQIQEKKDDYAVLEIDGSIRACGALHNWGKGNGEIAAVATDPQYGNLGIGKQIVGFLIEKAQKIGMNRVFVLTTQTQDWFESLGFLEATPESLPEQKLKFYDLSRKSKIFALEL